MAESAGTTVATPDAPASDAGTASTPAVGSDAASSIAHAGDASHVGDMGYDRKGMSDAAKQFMKGRQEEASASETFGEQPTPEGGTQDNREAPSADDAEKGGGTLTVPPTDPAEFEGKVDGKKKPDGAGATKPATTVTDDQRQKARDTLKRAKWTPETIESLSDDLLLANAENVGKVLSDKDSGYSKLESQLQESNAQVAQLTQQMQQLLTAQQQQLGDGGEPASPQPLPELLDAAVNSFLEPFSDEQLYPGTAEALKPAAQQLVRSVMEQASSQVTEMRSQSDQQMAAMCNLIDNMSMQLAAQPLSATYPGMSDPAKVAEVQTKARALAQSDRESKAVYWTQDGQPNWGKMMSDAAMMTFGQPDTNAQSAAALAAKQAHRAAQTLTPDTPTGEAPPQALTNDAKMKNVLALMAAGKSGADVEAAISAMG